MPLSFDENKDGDSVFIDSKMDKFDEEEMQPPKRKKNEKKCPTTNDTILAKRKKTSKWWAHFSIDEEDTDYDSCKYCQQRIGCSTNTPLANHINRCKMYPPNLDKKQKLIDFKTKRLVNEDGTTEIVSVPKLWEFDNDLSRKKLAKMLIVDELSFAFVECEGFVDFCKALNPLFRLPSRTTTTRDCYALFIEQRNNLKVSFKNLHYRVCVISSNGPSSIPNYD
ncbi:hypothetical protein V6N13_043378 [Hibiscus sabdariffa]